MVNKKNIIHVVLAHSYLVYFAGLLAGFLVDMATGWSIRTASMNQLGITLLFLGPLLIVWAQSTTRSSLSIEAGKSIRRDNFYKGPYCMTRSPTHLGLGLMILGLAFVFNSVPMVTSTLLCFLITRYVFIRKEEKLLEEKYGDPYRAYKRKVRF